MKIYYIFNTLCMKLNSDSRNNKMIVYAEKPTNKYSDMPIFEGSLWTVAKTVFV